MRVAFVLLASLAAVSIRAQVPRMLTVEEAIARARERAPERLRVEALDAQAATLRQAGSNVFTSRPEIEAEYLSEAPFGERDYELTLGISQEIPIWGTGSKRSAVAAAYENAAQTERETLDRRVELQTRMLYNRAWAYAQQVALGNRLIVSSNRLVDASNKRLAAGDMSTLERNTLVLEANKQRIEHEDVHSEYEQAIGELQMLTGLDLSNVVLEADNARMPALVSDTSTLYLLSPDWRRLENEIRIAEAKLELARAQSRPNPTIGLLYSQDLLTIDGDQIEYRSEVERQIESITAPGRAAGVHLSMQLPISIPGIWGPDVTKIVEREAELRMLQAEQALLRIELGGKSLSLRSRVARIQKALEIYDASIQLIEENHDLLDRGYDGGELSVTELLVGRQQLTQLQSDQLELIRDMREVEIELQRILDR